MGEILGFIASHMGYLWIDARFRVLGATDRSTNSNATFVVESRFVRLKFTFARGELNLEFLPIHAPEIDDWVHLDIVQTLMLGRPDVTSHLDVVNAQFLVEHLAEIETAFSPDNWAETKLQVDQLRLALPPRRFARA